MFRAQTILVYKTINQILSAILKTASQMIRRGWQNREQVGIPGLIVINAQRDVKIDEYESVHGYPERVRVQLLNGKYVSFCASEEIVSPNCWHCVTSKCTVNCRTDRSLENEPKLVTVASGCG